MSCSASAKRGLVLFKTRHHPGGMRITAPSPLMTQSGVPTTAALPSREHCAQDAVPAPAPPEGPRTPVHHAFTGEFTPRGGGVSPRRGAGCLWDVSPNLCGSQGRLPAQAAQHTHRRELGTCSAVQEAFSQLWGAHWVPMTRAVIMKNSFEDRKGVILRGKLQNVLGVRDG